MSLELISYRIHMDFFFLPFVRTCGIVSFIIDIDCFIVIIKIFFICRRWWRRWNEGNLLNKMQDGLVVQFLPLLLFLLHP
jgi:hypothetical protein